MSNLLNKAQVLAWALLAGTLLVGGPLLESAERKTLEGTVSDAMCGIKHGMGDMSDAECTVKCVEMGSKYALVVGGDVYELDGKSDDLRKLAGQKAKLTGMVDGKKIQVESVAKF